MVIFVYKAKEMKIGFRRSKFLPDPITMNDHTVERIYIYKYLGVMLNDDVLWSHDTDFVISKLISHIYCLRICKEFSVDIGILKHFYQLVIKSLFTYCCVCWGGHNKY